jgi:hypothetical protein
MAEINGTERKRPSRSIMPADEKLPVGREEATEMLPLEEAMMTLRRLSNSSRDRTFKMKLVSCVYQN